MRKCRANRDLTSADSGSILVDFLNACHPVHDDCPAKGTARSKFSYMTAARGFSPQLSYLKESTTQEAYTMPGEQLGSEYKGPGPVLYSRGKKNIGVAFQTHPR